MTPRAEPWAQRLRLAEMKVQRAKHQAPDGCSQAFSHIGTCLRGFRLDWWPLYLFFLPLEVGLSTLCLSNTVLWKYTTWFLAHRSTNWDRFHPSVDRMQNLTYTWYRQLRWDVGLWMRFRWDFGLSVVAIRLLGMLGEANIFCTWQTWISEGRWQCTERWLQKQTEAMKVTFGNRVFAVVT